MEYISEHCTVFVVCLFVYLFIYLFLYFDCLMFVWSAGAAPARKLLGLHPGAVDNLHFIITFVLSCLFGMLYN